MSRHRSPHGFTLIEVLVVVAIIALLVAILLPSLNRAREAARTTLCGANIKEALSSTLIHYHETGMRRETWNTNFGWATFATKINKGETSIFTCPSDKDPLPVPAVFDRVFKNDGSNNPGALEGTTAGDGIYNRIKRDGANWTLDIQDQVAGNALGGDAYDDPATDIQLEYTASFPQERAATEANPGNAANIHNVYSYNGDKYWTVGGNGTNPGNVENTKLMWMSYGANAVAGLANVRGNPILVAEARKFGLFPRALGTYEADHLPRALRFRHGSKTGLEGLQGADYVYTGSGWGPPPSPSVRLSPDKIDRNYTPRNRLNAGFFDGHVENMTYLQMFPNYDDIQSQKSRPAVHKGVWIGNIRGTPTY